MTPPSGGVVPVRAVSPADAVLRRILAMDAAGMIVFGLAYLLLHGPLGRLLGLGGGPVLTCGGLMLAIGVGVAALAGRARPPAGAVRLVVAIGTAWVALSAASLVLPWWNTTAAGTVWTVLQAVPVSVFAVLQRAALRGRT